MYDLGYNGGHILGDVSSLWPMAAHIVLSVCLGKRSKPLEYLCPGRWYTSHSYTEGIVSTHKLCLTVYWGTEFNLYHILQDGSKHILDKVRS